MYVLSSNKQVQMKKMLNQIHRQSTNQKTIVHGFHGFVLSKATNSLRKWMSPLFVMDST